MNKHVLGATIAFLAAPAAAEISDVEGTGPTGWIGEVELAWLLTQGNSESLSQLLRADIARDGLKWRHSAEAEGVNTQVTDDETDEVERTVERYFASYKIDRKLGEEKANYLFNIVTYEKDAFSGYQYQASYAFGLGRQWTNTERQSLETELGPGYRLQCLEPEEGYNSCGDKEEQAILRAALRYRLAITQNATFREQVATEVTDGLAITRVETSLTSTVYESFALRLSHLLKHNSDPAAGKNASDYEVSVSLVYSF